MTGRTVLITGATAGIGLAAAGRLAGLGAKVVVTGRSPIRCRTAVGLIRADHPDADVDWLLADFGVLDDVRELADEYRRRYDRLDVLINNAGTLEGKASYTAQGIERTLAINHMAPFLLTTLLADLLIASAPARVVTVSSIAHQRGTIDFSDLELRNGYRPYRAYARSKLANLLFTYELARRLQGTGVTANALNPGLVRTGFGRGSGLAGLVAYYGTHLIYHRQSITAAQGSDTVVFLASSPEVETVTGEYFEQRKPISSSPASRDPQDARRLWDLSEGLTGAPWTATAVA